LVREGSDDWADYGSGVHHAGAGYRNEFEPAL
jgi:hypothetical protein